MTTGAAARFEYRAWGDQLEPVRDRLRSAMEPREVRDSAELYLVSAGTVSVNTKIRDDLLDIKVLVGVRDACEQWTVRRKAEFPIDASVLRTDVLPVLGVEPPALERAEYSVTQLVDDVVASLPGLVAVDVTKRREMFALDACSGEITGVTIDGRAAETVAVESSDLPALLDLVSALTLDRFDNVSYPRAIGGMLGGRFARS